ncbi:hypothetical protein [Streptomyces sp. NTK 937]|uniref:hypothetical protein n=1 Tax=Streptomyces sp. NTK 937 TaxID=1487711 RepID=UPI0004A914D2|nr:hypothetical protein [Streptomyces sp. NTK 937]KDQ65344.1 hypothetical protein DT87_31175 [Streptomyces sp. NTK 937]
MKKTAALLLFLIALLGVLAPSAFARDTPGPVSKITEYACEGATTNTTMGSILKAGADIVAGGNVCKKAGDKVEEKMEDWWQSIWDSVIGDLIRSGIDAAKWQLRVALTVSLMGPSLNLADTGLFTRDASLGGMLVWLGWVIAAFGVMWQLGKAAVTGQQKYWGEIARGYVLNSLLSGIGLTIVAALLKAGDVMTAGFVKVTFGDGEGIERVIATMLPVAVYNPILLGGAALVLLLVGFMQLILIFLRQSIIPIQCSLLPIAGGGLLGGKATQSWAPRLITSILMVIAYKPIVGVIICVGFAEMGNSNSLIEWLRGLTTLILAVLAPASLAKTFSSFGAEFGGAMSAGGAIGAVANVGGKAMGGSDAPSGGGSSGDGPSSQDDSSPSPVEQARYVEQSMGPQSSGSTEGNPQGGNASLPGQGTGIDAASAAQGAGAGVGAGVSAQAAGTAAVPGVGLALQVMDGVNDTVQRAASEMGDGGTT